MNTRQKQVIMILSRNSGYTTAGEIAMELNVNERTVRSDIDKINQLIEFIMIKSKKGTGYKIIVNKELDYYRFLKSIRSIDSVSVKNREGLIEIYERILLLGPNQSVTYSELEDEFFMSTSQLKKNIDIISSNLSFYDIELIAIGEKIYVQGSTLNLMSSFSEYVYHRGNSQLRYIDSIQYRRSILRLIRESGLIIGPHEFANFLIHLDILLLFHVEGIKYTDNEKSTYDLQKTVEFLIAKDIVLFLNKVFKTQLSLDDAQYVTIHLISKCSINFPSIETCSYDVLRGLENDDVDKSIQYIIQNYSIDYSKDLYLYNSLELYFHNLKKRNKMGTFQRTTDINIKKNNYRSYIIMAVDILQFLYPRMKYQHLFHEAVILSQHFYYSDLRNEIKTNNVALIVPEKNIETEILIYKINRDFSKYIYKFNVVQENKTKNLSMDNYNIILTTIPNLIDTNHMKIEPTLITQFYNKHDRIKIKELIDNTNSFRKLITQTNIKTFESKELAIQYINNSLKIKKINNDAVVTENSIFNSGIEYSEGYVLLGFTSKSETFMDQIELSTNFVWHEYKIETIFLLFSNIDENFHNNILKYESVINKRFPLYTGQI